MGLSPLVMKRLTRELAKLQRSPPDGIAIEVGEHDILDINGWIQGPIGTPYAGGYFKVHLSFVGTDFPAGPPKCAMKTKIFHPNIHSSGEICVSTLKKDWSSSFGIEHILLVIKCLLITPNPDSALDPEAGRLLQEAYSQYASTARIWTRVHASECPVCMKEDSEASDVPTSSFQAMALASAKRRESVAKIDDISTIRSLCHTQIGSGYSSAAAAQPLARSGSTNADLRHKPSFDMDARGKALTSLGSNTPSAHSIFAPTDSVAMSTATVTREMNKVSLNAKTMPSVKRRTHAVVRRGIKRL